MGKSPSQPNMDGVHGRNTYLKESHSGPQVIWSQLSCVCKIQCAPLHWESFPFIISHPLAATGQRLPCPCAVHHTEALARPPASRQESLGKFMTLSFHTLSLCPDHSSELTVRVLPEELRLFLELPVVKIQIDQDAFQTHHLAKSS